MTEQEFVKKCLTDICTKIGFAVPDDLTQRNFELISQEIEDATGTMISVSTIKRLMNGEFSRMPQTATLNAISTYLGYKNWQEYKMANKNDDHEPTGQPANTTNSITSRFPRFSINRQSILSAVIAVSIIAFLSFANFLPPVSPHYEKAEFSARKTTANEMPNTVVFNYDIENVDADSFFIQQSWDVNRRVRIYKGSHTLTDIYYEPGYHIAKLIANDSIIKTVDVSIPTDRWFLLAKEHIPKSIPQYISPARLIKNGCLALDKNDLDSSRVNTAASQTYIYYYFPKQIDVSSDNFILTARVRSKEVTKSLCHYIMYEVFCQRNFMYFSSTAPGCASNISAQFGEHTITGKTTDLSPVCTDVSQWMNIEFMVKDRQVTISFDHKKVFAAAYTNSSGLITGLGFISNGLCEVDAVSLKGLANRCMKTILRTKFINGIILVSPGRQYLLPSLLFFLHSVPRY